MGIDTIILVSRDSLKRMDMWDAKRLINNFSCRWYRFCERYDIDCSSFKEISIIELIKHMSETNKIQQKERDIIKMSSKFDIIFCTDTTDISKYKGYIDIHDWMYNMFEEAKKKL